MKTCDRCEDQYESYLVFVRDDFPSVVDYVSEDRDLCPGCRAALYPKQAFEGASEVEPKHDP